MRFTVLSPIATSMSAQMIFQFGFSDASAAAATAVTASRMRQSKVEIVRMMVTMKSSTLTCPQRVCSGGDAGAEPDEVIARHAASPSFRIR